MSDWRVRIGVALGLVLALLVAAFDGSVPESRPDHGPVLSDCDGAIRSLAIQYVPGAAPIVERAYRQFLGHLPEGVEVHVLAPCREAFTDFRRRLGPVHCRIHPVVTGHSMTCWSRDRWLALAPAGGGGPASLLLPREEDGAGIWPLREGDARVGADLAGASSGRLTARRSPLFFDGGDFVADGETIFVAPSVVQRNLGRTVGSVAELRGLLRRELKKEVVLLKDAPRYHAGMFLMLAGNRTALVGDPSLARAVIPAARGESGRSADPSRLVDAPDFTEETQRRFDAVAGTCRDAGYRVVRIPVLPDRDERTYLTYLNVIIDQRDGCRTVYMPEYQHAAGLNSAAGEVWARLGYRVRRVDCTDAYRHFGSLRCLVNVVGRSAADRS